jgi:signal transduction histidine kinase
MIFVFEFMEWLACLAETGLLFWLYGQAFHDERKNRAKYWDCGFAAGFACLVLYMNNIVIYATSVLLGSMFLCSVAALALYQTSYTRILSLTMLYMFCFCSTDMLVSNLYLFFGRRWGVDGDTIMTFSLQRIGLIVLAKTVMVLFIILMKRWFVPVVRSHYEKRILWITVTAFLGFLYFRDQAQSGFSAEMSSVWGLTVVICGMGIYSGYRELENQNEKMRSQMAEIQNKLLRENYQMVSHLYENNAKLYHDLNNHLEVLYQMIVSGRLDEAGAYISRIGEPVKELLRKNFTGNDMIDVIISSKKQTAEQLGIKVSVDAGFPANTHIQINDLCTILGNLLDNAIEGSKHAQHARICLKIRPVHQFVVIKVSNTIVKPPQMDKSTGRLVTKKEDQTRHGWGMRSVKTTLEKYNGTMKYQYDESEFKITVMLFNEI